MSKRKRVRSKESRRWHSLKWNAAKKNPPFEITKEYWLVNYWNQPCTYCGGNSNGGIDRVDNSLGYVLDNCVPCCFWCNTIKRDKSLKDLESHLIKVLKSIRKMNRRANGK